MTIRIVPSWPMHPDTLQELADELEQATGEDVEPTEVRGGMDLAAVNMYLDNAIQAAGVALAFAAWRRNQKAKTKDVPPIKGIIWGPNDTILREVPDED